MLILHVEPQHADSEVRALLAEVGPVDYLQCDEQETFLTALSARPYEAVFVRLGFAVDATALAVAPRLRFVVTPTTGLDHIDTTEAKRRGVRIISLRGHGEFLDSIRSTAEHTWALLLALVRRLPAALEDVREGRWRREPFLADELDGRTLGVIGLGRLGRMVAGYGLAFGMRVLANDVRTTAFERAPAGVERAELEVLLRDSDVVLLHIPHDAMTTGFLSRERIRMMKRGALLVNTARGELVDEGALLEALRNGDLGGVALDVLAGDSRWGERISEQKHPLLAYARENPNLLITPHVGGYGRQAIARTRHFVCELFERAVDEATRIA